MMRSDYSILMSDGKLMEMHDGRGSICKGGCGSNSGPLFGMDMDFCSQTDESRSNEDQNLNE